MTFPENELKGLRKKLQIGALYTYLAKKEIVVDMRFIAVYQSLTESCLKSFLNNQESPKDRGARPRIRVQGEVYWTVAG